ncbi:uncharacterized protein MELLADRAFT_60263 [Melampsora larici-populina 98AG31]|uniref:Uncharacterized protein n=1 Tax=Melampsora larici-populina (strain 98AG31 / pathotype 3-4-7) TaxID=747676 RepID=F4RAP3_MELLP|nr:uncharacterized protein MELLADRAFT_60263 [Melampsora larici-populina 98AG31]EGG10748.1 hypothetical protein MELLADRAFT_60263 [Melampsora larici-populina 98AG31]
MRQEVKPRLMILIFFVLSSLAPSFTFGFLNTNEKIFAAREPKLAEASSSASNVKHRIKYPNDDGVELNDLSYHTKGLPLSYRFFWGVHREEQRAQTVSLAADSFLPRNEKSLMEEGSSTVILKRWQGFLFKYPNLQTVESRFNNEVLHHLRGLIGGDQLCSMNYLIDHTHNLIAANEETRTDGTKYLIKVFEAFIASENNPTHFARLKVAFSNLLRESEPDDYYQPQCMWEIHKMVASIESKFLSHPDTASSVWNPDLPPKSFIIRVLKAIFPFALDLYDPVLALETDQICLRSLDLKLEFFRIYKISSESATLESVLEIAFIEAPRAHYILTSGGKHMTARELRSASDVALKETVSGIEKALQKKEGRMKDLTSADEMTLLKALYAMSKELKDRVKIGFITSESTTSGGSRTHINLPNLCPEGTEMARSFSELIDVAQGPVNAIGTHSWRTRMKIALRAFTPERLLQLHHKEPVFRQMSVWKNLPSLPEIKNLLKQIADPKLLKPDGSINQSRNHIEILHNFLVYLAIIGFENDSSSILLEVVKSAKILARNNGIFGDLDIALTARFTARYPTLAQYLEINKPIHRSLPKFHLHFPPILQNVKDHP